MVRVKVHANRTGNGDVIEQGRGPRTLPDEPIFDLDDLRIIFSLFTFFLSIILDMTGKGSCPESGTFTAKKKT